MTENHADPWSAVRSLADLGEVTVRWLTGELDHYPGHNHPERPPDPETAELVSVLVALNRAEFVTTSSQPAQVMSKDGHSQRAWVRGYCTEATFGRIAAAILGTELIALPRPPGQYHLCPVPVTIDGGQNFTYAGMSSGDPEVVGREFGGQLDGAMVATLAQAWLVDILDPVWGRKNLLWTRLTAGLVPIAGPSR